MKAYKSKKSNGNGRNTVGLELPDMATAGKYAAVAAVAAGVTYYVVNRKKKQQQEVT
jgi:hypothetical protein